MFQGWQYLLIVVTIFAALAFLAISFKIRYNFKPYERLKKRFGGNKNEGGQFWTRFFTRTQRPGKLGRTLTDNDIENAIQKEKMLSADGGVYRRLLTDNDIENAIQKEKMLSADGGVYKLLGIPRDDKNTALYKRERAAAAKIAAERDSMLSYPMLKNQEQADRLSILASAMHAENKRRGRRHTNQW